MTGAELARALLARWWVVGLVLVAGFGLVAGAFDPGGATWLGVPLFLALGAAAVLDGRVRLAGRTAPRPLFTLEGPLIWLLGAYVLTRAAGQFGPHLFPLVIGLVAWLVATFPRATWLKLVIVAVCVELGLTLAARQEFATFLIHGLVTAGAAYGLLRLSHAEAFRRRVEAEQAKAATESARQEKARGFGLLTTQAPSISSLPGLAEAGDRPTVGRMALDHLDRAFNLELDILRKALDLSAAIVLWHDRDRGVLSLRGYTGDGQVADGPYPDGAGIPGSVLRDGTEVAVAPVHAGAGGLPYRGPDPQGVGAVLAVAILPEDGGRPLGVLCIDRARPDRWTEAERGAVRTAARKLALDVAVWQRLKQTDTEATTIHRICAGLQTLNGALGIDQAASAALAAVRVLVHPDLAVVSTIRGGAHVVLRAEGDGAERLTGLHFAGDEGLVGKAIAHGRPLPVNGTWKGTQGVFTAADRLDTMRSLTILPLTKGEGGPIGALTVASRAEGAFGDRQQEVLALIATQVAVKLDRAEAHEQIREMATTDGLTGLANHRVFQQAFDNMLTRAQRQASPLCLLLIDIDHFKRLNDTCGHPFGDVVLRGVARVQAAAVRKVDLAARYGGEEFALLVEGSGEDGGRRLAERIRSEVEGLRFDHERGPVSVTLSVGIAAYPADGATKTELIDRADKALYHAKEAGRNQAVAWSDLAARTS